MRRMAVSLRNYSAIQPFSAFNDRCNSLLDDAFAPIVPHHATVVAVAGIDPELERPIDRILAAIVGGKRELNVALVELQEISQVPEADAEVGVLVVQIVPRYVRLELPSRGGHELGQPDRPRGAESVRVEFALEPHQAESELRIDTLADGGVEDRRRQTGSDIEPGGELDDRVGPVELALKQVELPLHIGQVIPEFSGLAGQTEERSPACAGGRFGIGRIGFPGGSDDSRCPDQTKNE